jgi:hypothetical protein
MGGVNTNLEKRETYYPIFGANPNDVCPKVRRYAFLALMALGYFDRVANLGLTDTDDIFGAMYWTYLLEREKDRKAP